MANPQDPKLEKLVRQELRKLPDLPAPATLIPRVQSAISETLAQQKLEQRIHQELRALPELQAPATFVPRVLLAIEARARQAWWRQPLLAWPVSLRIPVLLLAVGIAGLLLYGAFAVQGSLTVGSIAQNAGQWFAALSSLVETLFTLVNALLVVAKAGQQYVVGGLLLVFTMYLTCIGFGTACVRLALTNKRI